MVFATWDASFIYFLGEQSCLWRNRGRGGSFRQLLLSPMQFSQRKAYEALKKTGLHECKTKIVENSTHPLIHFPGKGGGRGK